MRCFSVPTFWHSKPEAAIGCYERGGMRRLQRRSSVFGAQFNVKIGEAGYPAFIREQSRVLSLHLSLLLFSGEEAITL
jgi:hypothetical protein